MYVCDTEVSGDEVAVITTNKGVIRFAFFASDAPNHVACFIERAREGFYDGTKWHRVVPGFVIQGGDPYSRDGGGPAGTGGPGYTIAQEFSTRPHLDGTVAMARSASPDSAGSQFYICLGEQAFLNGQYTVFGQVTGGLDVVHSIGQNDTIGSIVIE